MIKIKPARVALKIPYYIAKRIVGEVLLSVDISEKADIGGGLYIAHLGAIVIGKNVKAGKNFSIRQGVTLGGSGEGNIAHPVVGDNVIFAAGAKAVGNVNIGNNVIIGANAVVTADIPANARAVGIPARVINYDGVYGINIRPSWKY